MDTTKPKKPGRHSKGKRRLIGFRLLETKADRVSLVAKAEGYKYVSDWVAAVVDERLSRTDMHQVESKLKAQGEFPIDLAS
jgi:hypothetical protein